MEVKLHTFFILVLDGGKLSSSHYNCFYLQEKNPWYSLDRRLNGLHGHPDMATRRKILPLPGIKLQPSTLPPVTLLTEPSQAENGLLLMNR
jgi:hypothetical protein